MYSFFQKLRALKKHGKPNSYFLIMNTLNLNPVLVSNNATNIPTDSALEDALWILWYYEDDEYQELASESVIDSMIENFDCSVEDARSILELAFEVHDRRMNEGFYDN
jgi:hypothetical protein